MDVLDGVTSLVDKSLLSQMGPGDAEPRFIMLETIREYGRERLDQSGEMEGARRAHVGLLPGRWRKRVRLIWPPPSGRRG